ncbi:MAG: ABC transporter ATP-binding protein [Lacipirellulaceae bacterium]
MPAIEVHDVRHRYGEREALGGVTLDVVAGETLALLGPNGSGKTTLFKLMSTLATIQSGAIRVMGHDASREPAAVRAALGVVFQSPSLDKKLRVEENLRCAGALYGVRGAELRKRIDAELERFQVADRRRDFVETLSGGLRRRVELAQAMLHHPRVLLLDEPSTGLDPAARGDLWRRLDEARRQGVTVVVTTHLLEEAEKADRLAILAGGKLVALDTPHALQSSIGGDTLTLRSSDAAALAAEVAAKFGAVARVIDDTVCIDGPDALALAPLLYEAFRDRIADLSIGKPTLEDVFIARTGRKFSGD